VRLCREYRESTSHHQFLMIARQLGKEKNGISRTPTKREMLASGKKTLAAREAMTRAAAEVEELLAKEEP